MSNATAFAARRRLWPALALILPLLAPQPASAQTAGAEFAALERRRRPECWRRRPVTRGEPFGSGGVPAPQSAWPLAAPRATAPTVGADGAGRAGRARAPRALRQGRAADQRRPALAHLCRQARRRPANFQLVKEDKSPGADLRAAGRRLHRACRLRARHRGQAGDACAGRPCARISIFRPARCASKAASATCAFRPDRFRSTSTRAASSSPATGGRSPST